jgi:hypothetical protein
MSLEDNQLEQLARELHEEWDSPSLWPRIQADLIAARPVRKTAQFWGLAFAMAAIVVVTLVLAQLMPSRIPPDAEADFLTRETLRDVERSEAAYARSIEKLATIARPSLDQSTTPLAAAYREKLLILDAAIADLKANSDANPYNSYLRNQMAALYRDKQLTLEEWLKNAKDN